MTEQAAVYSRDGNVGIITLNRPERLNAINKGLLRAFIEQIETARQDKEVVAVILTGAGRAFCAGEDLKETSAGKNFETWIEETDGLQDVQRAIMALGKPLIAAVRGYALGGGCEFALSCDIRIAAADAKFGFPETEVGLTVTTAGTKLLAQIVGLGKAKELIFTGEFIDAQEAMRIGLANKVVPVEDLQKETLAMARKIAEKSQTLEMEANHLLICANAENQKEFVERKLKKMKEK
jgi:enoyl-CoA hydratase